MEGSVVGARRPVIAQELNPTAKLLDGHTMPNIVPAVLVQPRSRCRTGKEYIEYPLLDIGSKSRAQAPHDTNDEIRGRSASRLGDFVDAAALYTPFSEL